MSIGDHIVEVTSDWEHIARQGFVEVAERRAGTLAFRPGPLECPGFQPPGWFACAYPERPPDRDCWFHLQPRCHGCDVAREAQRRRET